MPTEAEYGRRRKCCPIRPQAKIDRRASPLLPLPFLLQNVYQVSLAWREDEEEKEENVRNFACGVPPLLSLLLLEGKFAITVPDTSTRRRRQRRGLKKGGWSGGGGLFLA